MCYFVINKKFKDIQRYGQMKEGSRGLKKKVNFDDNEPPNFKCSQMGRNCEKFDNV